MAEKPDGTPSSTGVRSETPSSSQCETGACCHDMSSNGRNLVIFMDSYINQYAATTNVVELYKLASNTGSRQLTWFDSGKSAYIIDRGVVAHGSPGGQTTQLLILSAKLLIAWKFRQTVQDAFRWLCDNYEEGDRIFCFGFSRGALQVRVLSAMIAKIGLISKGNETQIPFAYNLYCGLDSNLIPGWWPQKRPSEITISTTERFKSTFSRDVKVHFVGAWDTVPDLGILRNNIAPFPGVAEGMDHVCYFRHALALDEHRVRYIPLHAERVPSTDRSYESQRHFSNCLVSRPQTLEVWFAGTHGDIGGGNAAESQPALRWMLYEAGSFGLRTNLMAHHLRYSADIKVSQINKFMPWIFSLLEFLPIPRDKVTISSETYVRTYMPHLFRSRRIKSGQKVHYSALHALRTGSYFPKARMPYDVTETWDTLSLDTCVAYDADQLMKTLMNKVVVENDHASWDAVTRFAVSEIGKQAVYEEVMHYLTSEDGDTANDKRRSQLIRRARALLMDHRAQLHMLPEIKAKQSGLHRTPMNMYEKEERRFLDEFTTYQRLVLKGHRSPVLSIAISGDGTRIVSGSQNGIFLEWDAYTGGVTKEYLIGHKNPTTNQCVVFSSNRVHMVSTSPDKTIMVWDNTTPPQTLQGHHHSESAVSFSPDATQLVSGSQDNTLSIWDVNTGAMMGQNMGGHTDAVLSVTFSPDGKWIASGSADATVCFWGVNEGRQLGLPCQGHECGVHSVAFSLDGTRVVSGSADCTIRIWDVRSGLSVGQPLVGHEGAVRSVSFSPDGSRIASGSSDRTVRIWDVETGKQIGEPLKGHRRDVNCVCFSPDGTRVISGSSDWTLRIWDVTLK